MFRFVCTFLVASVIEAVVRRRKKTEHERARLNGSTVQFVVVDVLCISFLRANVCPHDSSLFKSMFCIFSYRCSRNRLSIEPAMHRSVTFICCSVVEIQAQVYVVKRFCCKYGPLC